MSEMGVGGSVGAGVSITADESGLVRAIQTAVEALDKLEKSISTMTNAVQGSFTKIEQSVGDSANKINTSVNTLSGDISKIESVMNSVSNTSKQMGKDVSSAGDDAGNLNNKIRPSIATLDRLQEQFMRVRESSKRIGDAAGTFDNVTASVERYHKWVKQGFDSQQEMTATTATLTREFQHAIRENQTYEQTMINLQKSIGTAEREVSGMVARLQSMGDSEQYVTQLNDALDKYKVSMNEAAGDTVKITAAKEEYKNKIQQVKNELARQGKGTSELAVQNQALQKSFQNVTKSVQLALGPLSGVAARVTALSAIIRTNAPSVAMFTASLVGITVALSNIVSSSIEFERQMMGISSALESTGHSAQITTRQLNEMAEGIAEATLSGTVETRQAAIALTTFQNIGVESFQAILESAQGLSSVFGGNLQTNARLLGRALENPTSSLDSLRRVGIQFTLQQREQIKSMQQVGNVAGAQAIIMERVASFQQLAKDEAQGLAGQLDTMGERFGRLSEQVGVNIGVNDKFGNSIALINENLKALLDGSGQVQGVMVLLGKAVDVAAWGIEFFANNMNTLTIIFSGVFAAAAVRTVMLLTSMATNFIGLKSSTLLSTTSLYGNAKASYVASGGLMGLMKSAAGTTVTMRGLTVAMRALGTALPILAGLTVIYSLVSSMGVFSSAGERFSQNMEDIAGTSKAAQERMKLFKKETELSGEALLKNLEAQKVWLEYQSKGVNQAWSAMTDYNMSLHDAGRIAEETIDRIDFLPIIGASEKARRSILNAFGIRTATEMSKLSDEAKYLASVMEQDIRAGLDVSAERVVELQKLFDELGQEIDVQAAVDSLREMTTETERLENALNSIREGKGTPRSIEELRKGFESLNIAQFADTIDQLNRSVEVSNFASAMNSDIEVAGKTVKAYTQVYAGVFDKLTQTAKDKYANDAEMLAKALRVIDVQRRLVENSLSSIGNTFNSSATDAAYEWVSGFARELEMSGAVVDGVKSKIESLKREAQINDKVSSAIQSMGVDFTNASQMIAQADIVMQDLGDTLTETQRKMAEGFFVDGMFDVSDDIKQNEKAFREFLQIFVAVAVDADIAASKVKDFTDTIYDMGNAIRTARAYNAGGSQGFINMEKIVDEEAALRSLRKTLSEMGEGDLRKLANTYGLVITAGEGLREQVVAQMEAITLTNRAASEQVSIYESVKESIGGLAGEVINTRDAYNALMTGGVEALNAVMRKQEVEDTISDIRKEWLKLTNAVDKKNIIEQLSKQFPELTINAENALEVLEQLVERSAEIAEQTERAKSAYETFNSATDDLIKSQQRLNDEVNILRNGGDIIAAEELQRARELNEEFTLMGRSIEDLAKLNSAFPDLFQNAENYEQDMVEMMRRQRVQKEWISKWEGAQKQFQDIARQGFHDIFDNGIDGFGDMVDKFKNMFKKMLIDMAYDALLNPIMVNLSAGATGFMGQLSSALGGGGGSGGSGGGGFNWTNIVSLGRTLYSAISGGLGGIASSIGGGLYSIGNAIGWQGLSSFGTGMAGNTLAAGVAGPTTAGASGAMGAGAKVSSAFTAAWPLAIIAGWIQSGKLYDAGVRADYDATQSWSEGSSGIGQAAWLPMSVASWAQNFHDELLGKVSISGKIFGDKFIAMATGSPVFQNLSNIFGRAIFGNQERFERTVGSATGSYKGGEYSRGGADPNWFPGTQTFGGDFDSTLSNLGEAFSMSIGALYDMVGRDVEIDTKLNTRLRRTSGKLVAALTATIGDQLVEVSGFYGKDARVASSFEAFANDVMGKGVVQAIEKSDLPQHIKDQFEGLTAPEDVMNTIQGIQDRFNSMNEVLRRFGMSMLDASGESLKAGDAIIALMGGLDEFRSKASSYHDAFYPDESKAKALSDELSVMFEMMGLTLPSTNAGFRELVEGLDLTTEEGQAMFATLIEISPAFAELTKATDSLVSGFGVSAKSLKDILSKGLLGEADGDEVGRALVDNVLGGVHKAIASGFADTITEQMMGYVVKPMLMAVMTGTAITEAVSDAAIQTMIANAQAASEAMSVLMSDESFIEFMSNMEQALMGVGNSVSNINNLDGMLKQLFDTFMQSLNITQNSIKGVFQTALSEATSAGEAGLASAAGGAQMMIDSIGNVMMDTVSNIVYQAVVEPLITNIAMAATQGSMIEITAKTQGAAIEIQGAAMSAEVAVNGAAQSAQTLAAGGVDAANAMVAGGNAVGSHVSQVIESARAALSNIIVVLRDPEFKEAMNEFGEVMQGVGGELFDAVNAVGVNINSSIPQVDLWNKLQLQRNTQQEVANNAAEKANKLAEERLSLENQWLQAVGNTMELRRRELAQLHPANRALQESIWSFQDLEQAVDVLMNRAIAAAQDRVNELGSTVSTLSNAMRSFNRESDKYISNDRMAAKDILRDALSGVDVSNKDLQSSLDTLTSNNARSYSSMVDYMRDQLQAQSLIGTLLNETETQLSIEEQTLKMLEEQANSGQQQHEQSLSVLLQQLEEAKRTASQFAGINHNLDRVSNMLSVLSGSNMNFSTAPSAQSVITSSASDAVQADYNAQHGISVDNSDLVIKLEELRLELEHIRAGNVQIAKNTGRSLDIDRKWDGGGLPPFRDGLVVDGGSF